MDKRQLKLHIKNIRSIHDAEIAIDGITVIVGENGSGKSTISKLAYQIFKTSIDFDKIIDKKIKNESQLVFRTVDQLYREISSFVPKDEYLKVRNSFRRLYNSINQPDLFGQEFNINNAIDYLIELFNKIPNIKLQSSYENRLERIRRIIEDSLSSNKAKGNKDISIMLENLKEVLSKNYEKGNKLKEFRPLSILFEALDDSFYDNPIPRTFDILEYGVSIIDNQNKRLIPLHSIQNVAYIDTPMILGIDFFAERLHWDDLNNMLKQKGNGSKNKSIDSLFKETVLKGVINYKEDDFSDNSFYYKREDGSAFNLMECATGLKSFAILQILYKNGSLNKNSILIIDEPEVHLHPQWVVEYARLIVLLNKYLGVKFLIASHHPDMISAIRYISEKEGNINFLNFYLAEKVNENFKYDYRNLGLDIEDIFSSFNIALERIDLYGKTN